MEFDRPRIKETAKAVLHEAQPRPWKVTLVFQLLLYGLPLALMLLVLVPALTGLYLIQGPSMSISSALSVLFFLVYLSLLLLMVLFTAGYVFYTLKLWRREGGSYRDLFHGFSAAPRLLALFGLVLLFSFLWSLPVFAVLEGAILLAQRLAPAQLNLLFFPLLMGAWVFLISRILRYALAFHVLLDHPEYTARQALNQSKALMVGQRWRLAVFLLSFLGWMLLALLILYAVAALAVLLLFLLFPAVQYSPQASTLAALCALVLAWLASAPLSLWLTGYLGVSLAGVYDRLQGAPQVPSAPPWQPPTGEEPGLPE